MFSVLPIDTTSEAKEENNETRYAYISIKRENWKYASFFSSFMRTD